MRAGRSIKTAADTSEELRRELSEARAHPREIFGYARYGDGEKWVRLDVGTGGIQELSLSILASRPKRGKSMLAAAWVPFVAEQAMVEDKVVRVVTLEMRRKSYQRRMAALMAGISNPMNIRRGTLEDDEVSRYLAALKQLEALPIEYLSNEEDLDEDAALVAGNSPVTFDEMSHFIRGRGDTYWWVLDHIGLLSDLSSYGDVTTSIYNLANKLASLAHRASAGLVITHLNRATVGNMPTIESIAGSDQVGRNADQIFLLSRPFMDMPDLSDEDKELVRDGEPAFLQFFSRDEGSGVDVLWWDHERAAFEELYLPEGTSVPLPSKRKK
jgi:hypothetical protein